MPDASSFHLFTSVSPRLNGEALKYQRSCIASWRSVGFNVATVNGRSEVAQIRAYDLDAEILTVEDAGKPSIADILMRIRANDLRYAGIINADCLLLPYPDLAEHLAEILDGKVVVVERLDVDDQHVPQPDTCSGFDAFFFDAAAIPAALDRDFRIGVPWWDYCFPMAAAAGGAQVINIETPLLVHRMHNHAWSHEERERVGQKFWRFLKDWRASKRSDFPVLGDEIDGLWPEETLTRDELAVVGLACFRWLKSQRQSSSRLFMPQHMESIEALLSSQRAALNQLNQRLNQEVGQLHRLEGKLRIDLKSQIDANAVLEHHLSQERERIQAIEGSTSWRLTKPLREIGRLFRGPV